MNLSPQTKILIICIVLITIIVMMVGAVLILGTASVAVLAASGNPELEAEEWKPSYASCKNFNRSEQLIEVTK